jgi:hypothetical protein
VKVASFAVLFLLFSIPALADSGNPTPTPQFDAYGTLIFQGADGSSEIINFNFELGDLVCDYANYSPQTCRNNNSAYSFFLVGTPDTNSTGPLGQFTNGGFNNSENYEVFSDAGGDEVDIYFNLTSIQNDDPVGEYTEIYRCGSVTCANEYSNGEGYEPGGVNQGTLYMSVSPITVPEPVPLGMLFFGVSIVLLAGRRHFCGRATQARLI